MEQADSGRSQPRCNKVPRQGGRIPLHVEPGDPRSGRAQDTQRAPEAISLPPLWDRPALLAACFRTRTQRQMMASTETWIFCVSPLHVFPAPTEFLKPLLQSSYCSVIQAQELICYPVLGHMCLKLGLADAISLSPRKLHV